MHADDKTSILSAITTLKSSLADFIEPDFGLLNELLRLHVLTRRQAASVRKKETVFDRNDALLEQLTSEEQCVKFLTALQRTGQHHVVNFITQNGGQKHKCNDVVTYLVTVLYAEEQTITSHFFGLFDNLVFLPVSFLFHNMRGFIKPLCLIVCLSVYCHSYGHNFYMNLMKFCIVVSCQKTKKKSLMVKIL